MAYTEILYGSTDTDPLSAPVVPSQTELEEGLKCGRLDLPALKGTFAKIFADLKFIHDADDFLENINLSEASGAVSFAVDLNEVEDSADSAFSITTDANLTIGLSGTQITIGVDIAAITNAIISNITAAQITDLTPKLFANTAFKTALSEFIRLHWEDQGGNLHFANGTDATGAPTFAP